MAAGIPVLLPSRSPHRRVNPAALSLGWWRSSGARSSRAGVEIIPLEPDQRSDLRREGPSVALTLPPSPFWGVG
jgi:hypothetical protein